MSLRFAVIIILVSVIIGLFLRMSHKGPEGLSPGDPNSFARPDICSVKSIHLNLDVDFETSKLKGFVDLELESLDGAESLILDTRDLSILNVVSLEGNKTGGSLEFNLGEPIHSFGSKLEIKLTKSTQSVRVYYETSPSSSALQWMKPAQTAGKKYPYLYSQCEAIHARSMLPCQDTPSVKAPYTAKISAPNELVVLMSAVRDGQDASALPNRKSFSFTQKIPIPSYLIAIAVGALESRKIGPRSHVWAEKEYVDKSAYEFSETEAMLQAAESFLGPYIWEIYDLLVLPPSFPFGGMENPCLTFLTPTLLAGDRSLACVVAHEISHSWTGNLVTNQNFEHFWLNEGFTVFVERKIISKLNDERYRHFSALGGWKKLQYTVNTLGKDNQLTQLVPDLINVDPDDAFSSIPYEKGHSFLFFLEQLLGGKEVFEGFLRAYIEEFKFKSINSLMFKEFLFKYFHDKVDILNTVDFDSWFYKPGMPPIKPKFDTSLANQCIVLSQKWINSSVDGLKSTVAEFKQLSSIQVLEFLELLLAEKVPLSVEKIDIMTDLYGFVNNHNAEIRFSWIRLGLLSRWEKIVPYALSFVTEIGRMKYLDPIYRDLYAWEDVRKLAIETFEKNRPEMMYMSVNCVSKVLHLR